MLKSEIIQQLNEGRSDRFPTLDVFMPIDVRLSAYRNNRDWAIVIENFYFAHSRLPHECPATLLWCFGSSLPQAPGASYPELHTTGDGPSGPLFDSNDFDDKISSSITDMRIRNRIVPITTDPAAYEAAGINLHQPPRILGHELLRLIAPKHRRLFFATEAEIVERIGEAMPLLLRLDEWYHPDRDKGETPADSESFQMIADVIAHDDPSLYRPTVPANTHWSNWPMAGRW